MKGVITISRETGSLGDAVGYELARRLGYTCVNRSFVDLIARKARVAPWQVERLERTVDPRPAAPAPTARAYDEREGRSLDELIRRLGYGERLNNEEYLAALRGVMSDLAAIGRVVIIGRGGQVLLHGHPDAFHVRILAPTESRIERFQADEEVSRDLARRTIDVVDGLRAELLRQMGAPDADDPALYDLVIQSGGLTVSQCTVRILEAMEAKERAEAFEPSGRLD